MSGKHATTKQNQTKRNKTLNVEYNVNIIINSMTRAKDSVCIPFFQITNVLVSNFLHCILPLMAIYRINVVKQYQE